MDGNGLAPWKTGENHILGTNTHTRTLTRTRERAHVKNLADARRGREWTRAMENWAKPRSSHTRTHTLSPSHTQTRAQTHTDTHKHPFIWILISPHVRMCISHTHSLVMYMSLHVTQHKAPCTCLSLSSTHIDTKNMLSLPQSLTYHTRTLSLSLANMLNKGFPVNNLPSIHQ